MKLGHKIEEATSFSQALFITYALICLVCFTFWTISPKYIDNIICGCFVFGTIPLAVFIGFTLRNKFTEVQTNQYDTLLPSLLSTVLILSVYLVLVSFVLWVYQDCWLAQKVISVLFFI